MPTQPYLSRVPLHPHENNRDFLALHTAARGRDRHNAASPTHLPLYAPRSFHASLPRSLHPRTVPLLHHLRRIEAVCSWSPVEDGVAGELPLRQVLFLGSALIRWVRAGAVGVVRPESPSPPWHARAVCARRGEASSSSVGNSVERRRRCLQGDDT